MSQTAIITLLNGEERRIYGVTHVYHRDDDYALQNSTGSTYIPKRSIAMLHLVDGE
jgi:hypothetical protein